MNLEELAGTLTAAGASGRPALVVRAESSISPPLEVTDAAITGGSSSSSSSGGSSPAAWVRRLVGGLVKPSLTVTAPAFGGWSWSSSPYGRPAGWKVGAAVVGIAVVALLALAVYGLVALVRLARD